MNKLNGQLNKLTISWMVSFQQIAERVLGKETGKQLWQKYQSAFPIGYQTQVSPRSALKDILHLNRLSTTKHQDISLHKPYKETEHYRLHFYSQQERFLDEYIPVLENMHLRVIDQVQFPITVDDTTQFIRSFTIKIATSQCAKIATNLCAPLSSVNSQLLKTIQVILDGKSENDALNKLLVLTGMSWQEIDILRAYRNYYLQLGHQTTRDTVNHALINNPSVALCLFNYFEARFRPNPAWDDPVLREEEVLFPLRLQLLESMASVSDINDDKILRTLFNLIDATMRCNFHLRRSLDDYFVAFKINSLGVIECPPLNRKTRFMSMRSTWKAYICAAARFRGAEYAGPIGPMISEPKFWVLCKPRSAKMP